MISVLNSYKCTTSAKTYHMFYYGVYYQVHHIIKTYITQRKLERGIQNLYFSHGFYIPSIVGIIDKVYILTKSMYPV